MLNLQIFHGILADSKKDAEEEVTREISGAQNVCESEKMASKLGKRNRKRKSFGKEFESNESEGLDAADDKGKKGINTSLPPYFLT